MTSPITSSQMLDEMGERLSCGEHPQDLLEEIVKSLTLRSDHPQACECILFLAERGARVATGEPGCAFGKILRTAPGVAMDILHGLALRPGELPFHMIAAGEVPNLISPPKIRDPDFQASLLACDAMGRTVSHYLWDTRSELAQYRVKAEKLPPGSDETNNQKQWRQFMSRFWQAQQLLLDHGFSMELPDHQGRTALDLCVDRMEAGDLLLDMNYQALGDKVQVHLDHRRMLRQTVQATTPTRTAPRL